MKHLLLPIAFAAALTVSSQAGSFGPGPWANDAYYPGQLDGRYSASVYGTNITGVLGFALRGGSPSTLQESTVLTNGVQNTVGLDPFQNYFVIFVEGRTYQGVTIGSININKKTVTGALIGVNATPDFSYITNTNGAITGVDTLGIVNRGLSGAFNAKIKSDNSIFTFRGDGELSTPANSQTVTFSPSPTNATNATIVTTTTEFGVDGIKVSDSSASTFDATTQ